jgi:hypothetical protein
VKDKGKKDKKSQKSAKLAPQPPIVTSTGGITHKEHERRNITLTPKRPTR